MLNITHHQGNANQSHNELQSHKKDSRWLSTKRQEITSVGRDMEKRVILYTVSQNINWIGPQWKTVQRLLKKVKLSYNPAIPFLGIFLKKTKTLN